MSDNPSQALRPSGGAVNSEFGNSTRVRTPLETRCFYEGYATTVEPDSDHGLSPLCSRPISGEPGEHRIILEKSILLRINSILLQACPVYITGSLKL